VLTPFPEPDYHSKIAESSRAEKKMSAREFREFLDSLARAWRERRYDDAAGFFASDVHYVDPCRYDLRGRGEVLAFFRDDGGFPQTTIWRRIVFDEATQFGAAEYSYRGARLYHGVALVGLRENLIAEWREYQHVTESDWERFFRVSPAGG